MAPPRSSYRAAIAGLMAIHAGLLFFAIRSNFVVVDEMAHVPAGLSNWETGSFVLYRVNPPLGRMVAALPLMLAGAKSDYHRVDSSPGVRSEWDVGHDFAEANAPRYLELMRLARLPGILWSLAGLGLIARWAGEIYGPKGGLLAGAIWCFDPTVLAFASVVTPDIPSAVAGLGATYAFRRYLQTGLWWHASLAGILLGVAQLTKFTMLLLYGIWPLLWLAQIVVRRDKVNLGRVVPQAILIVGLSLYVINLGYWFDGPGRRLGDFAFVSRSFRGQPKGWGPTGQVGNRFDGTLLGQLPSPLPAEFLLGIDAQRKDFESEYPSYLRGTWRTVGWWYYYIYALAVKEPAGTILLVGWGLALTLARRRAAAGAYEEWVLLAPTAAVLAFVSSQTGFNHHMRYILPVFPFVAVATGKLAWFFGRDRRVGLAVGLLLGWSVTSSLSVAPHWMSYFNEAAGGPARGHDHLLDSNIDWGQDLLGLKQWLDGHPEARPLGLAYFSFLDPHLVGIEYELPPVAPVLPEDRLPAQAARFGPRPGWFAISVNYLRGLTFAAPDGRGGTRWIGEHDSFAYFQQFRPVGRAGYSIYIYKITPAEAQAARLRMGLPSLPPEEMR